MPEEQEDVQQEDVAPAESAAPEDAETSVSAEELDALRVKAEKADEWKGFADRTAAENKRLKKQLKTTSETTETNSSNETTSIPDERFERLELKTDGYSDVEIAQIMDLGGKQALANPILQEAIALQRKRAKSKEATPSGTAKSPAFKGITDKDLKTMPLADFEKLVSEE